MGDLADILVIDDLPSNLQLLDLILEEAGYAVRPINSGQAGLKAAQIKPPDLILLDVNMPEMNGYEVCSALKSDQKLQNIPVIFISALDETTDKVRGFQVGGVDYITKPFQAEEVLARVQTHLELRRNRMEVEQLRAWERAYFERVTELKDELLRTASHDLKNPLSNIMSAVGFLRSSGLLDQHESGKQYLNMIQNGAEKMQTLIVDLLDLARIDTGLGIHPRDVHLNRLLETVLEEFILKAHQKSISLKFKPLVGDDMVNLDPDRINQAVSNLVSNAIKYTPKGGQVSVAAAIDHDLILIDVIDNGYGIPPEDLPHIFERFYRVNRTEHLQSEGTGLGMTIIQSIVEQHGGDIEVESELGVGSTFRMTLPLFQSETVIVR